MSARPWLTLLVSEEKIVQAMSSCPQQSSGKSCIGARSKASKLMTSWNLYLMIFIVDFLVFYMHIFLKGVRLYEPEDGTCHRMYPTASSLKEQSPIAFLPRSTLF